MSSPNVPHHEQWVKVTEYRISRVMVGLYTLGLGVLMGIVNSFLDLDLSLRLGLLGWVVLALVVVVLLHEATHGAAAWVLGHRPIFGIKPPLVFITFAEKVPRGHFLTIALAPLVLLDTVFATLYAAGVLKLFSSLCFMINSLGAAGDLWMVIKVAQQGRGTYVQDTKSGVEIWEIQEPSPDSPVGEAG